MKRTLMIMFLVVPISVFATDMCARDDTMVMVFDSDSEVLGYKTDRIHWTWYQTFSYGVVSGESTCVSDAELESNNLVSGLYDVDAAGNKRKNCRCRMTHPVVSGWVESDSSEARANCTTYCSDRCRLGFVPMTRYLNAVGIR